MFICCLSSEILVSHLCLSCSSVYPSVLLTCSFQQEILSMSDVSSLLKILFGLGEGAPWIERDRGRAYDTHAHVCQSLFLYM